MSITPVVEIYSKVPKLYETESVLRMQMVPYISQQVQSQQANQLLLAIQQQLVTLTGTQYVPPLYPCQFAVDEFKWYKRYGIIYFTDGTKKARVTEADVTNYLNKLKSIMDIITFEEKVDLAREGYLSFCY